MRAGRGFSLIELLICGVLIGFFLTSVVAALFYCNRYLRTAEAKIAAQTACLQTTTWVSRSLAESTLDAVTTTPGLGVCLASPREIGSGEVSFSQGQILWRQTMAYYLTTDAANRTVIEHKGFPYTGPPQLDPMPPMPVLNAVTTATVHRRIIARDVRSFEVEVYSLDPIHPPEVRGCARILVETFLPHYGLDYGITVRTQVKLEN